MCVSMKALGATSEAKGLITARPSPSPPSRARTACHTARGRRRAGRKRRRGAAVIEFAVVAPLLFLLILVIFEFGRMVMAHQILTNAAREGARRAILEQSTAAEVQQTITNYLARNSISGASGNHSTHPRTKAGVREKVTQNGCV